MALSVGAGSVACSSEALALASSSGGPDASTSVASGIGGADADASSKVAAGTRREAECAPRILSVDSGSGSPSRGVSKSMDPGGGRV